MTGLIDYNESVDMLSLFFDLEDFELNEHIKIHQPSIEDIVRYPGGEECFLFNLYVFCGNTTHFRVVLWDNGVDWNKITDFQLFADMVTKIPVEQTKIIFGDLDFTKFRRIIKGPTEEHPDIEVHEIMYDPINDIEITEFTYLRMRNYLRHMFNIFPKIEVGIKKKRLKREIIEYDRKLAERNAKKSSGSYYLPMISFCLNHPGFKYNKTQLRDVGIVEFMDSVQRLSVIEDAIATLRGAKSGFVDATKISPESFNFMKDIYADKRSKTAYEEAMHFKDNIRPEQDVKL